MSLVTGHFFPVLLLNQQWSPPLTLQASHCITFRIMCDVPSTAVFCSESMEYFLVGFPNCSLSFLLFQRLQLLLVQSYISGSIFAVSLYINSCILTYFPLPFAQFCLRVLPHLSVCTFIIIIIIIIIIINFWFSFSWDNVQINSWFSRCTPISVTYNLQFLYHLTTTYV